MRILLLVLMSLTLCQNVLVTKPPGIALLTAAQKGKKGRLTDILLRGNLDINYTEKYGRYRGYTALMWAADVKHHGIVQRLLEMDANVNHKSYFDETAIYLASKRGSLKIVKTLLKYGANPNIPTVLGFTALLQATWNRYLAIVVELLANGADPDYQSVKSKYFALYLAARQNDINIVSALLQANASVNLQTSWGVSALEAASVWGYPKTMKILLEAGANPNIRNNYNQTPIMKAALYGHAPIIHDLVNYGAEVDLQDNRGNTALMWASKRGHIQVITKLIQAGADPFIEDNTGRTSFQWAVRNGDTMSMEELLKNPCSGNSPRKFGICQRSLSRIGTTIAHEVAAPSPSTLNAMGTLMDDTLEEVTLSSMEPITATETTETTTPEVDLVSQYFVIRCSAASLLVPELKIVMLSWFFQWQGFR